MHVILATFGTDGDVFPYLGLGSHLVERGHTVSLAAGAQYESAATQGGMDFHQILSVEEAEVVLANPDFWNPVKAAPLAAKWGMSYIPRQFDLLSRLAQKPDSFLIGNPGVLAARLLHDKEQIPFASIILQPWIVPSVDKPPVLPGVLSLVQRAPRWIRRLYFNALSVVGYSLLGRKLNRFRKELGLPRIQRVFDWWFSPQLILALFPKWFGPPQSDWPRQIQFFSFPSFDGSANAKLSPELKNFLHQGESPIAITFGTGVRHAHELYHTAIHACAKLGRRAIVITKHPQQLPTSLPHGIISTNYAPFTELLPQCAAIVHHGGIGTTARALQSKTPQLIVPICFDQLDNALRVESLKCGTRVTLKNATTERLARELPRVFGMKASYPATETTSSVFEKVAETIEKRMERAA